MTMRRLLFTPALFILFQANLSAAEAVDPPPSPPFVARAPAASRWIVTIVSKFKAAEVAGKYQTVIGKSGDRRREVTVFSNGTRVEIFSVGGLSFVQRSGSAPGDVMVKSSPQQPTDFPELAWLSAQNYVGTARDHGRKYRVFAYSPKVAKPNYSGPETVIQPETGGRPEEAKVQAWIDAETGLPAKLTNSISERTYQFSEVTATDLDPSPDIRKRMEAYFEGKIPQ